MANILIIGGAGFIGSNLVKTLINYHNVLVFDVPDVNTNRLVPFENNISIFYGELYQYDCIVKILEENSVDIVIHLVSGLLPCSSVTEYSDEYKDVIIPTIRLLPYLNKNRIKFIFFSSGGTIYGTTFSLPINESEGSAPICYYGLSKQILEDSILFEHRTSGLEYLIIRPSNPFGPGQNINGKQGLISTSIGKIFNHEKIVIWGDGSIVRDYLFIDDLSYAIAELIRCKVRNEIINVGSGIGYSVNEIIQELRELMGEDFIVEYTFGRSVDVPSLILDNSKLKNLISFSPISIKTGILKFLTYLGNKQ